MAKKTKTSHQIDDNWFWNLLVWVIMILFLLLVLVYQVVEIIDPASSKGTLWIIIGLLNGEELMFLRESETEPQFEDDILITANHAYLVWDVVEMPEGTEQTLPFDITEEPLTKEQLALWNEELQLNM